MRLHHNPFGHFGPCPNVSLLSPQIIPRVPLWYQFFYFLNFSSNFRYAIDDLNIAFGLVSLVVLTACGWTQWTIVSSLNADLFALLMCRSLADTPIQFVTGRGAKPWTSSTKKSSVAPLEPLNCSNLQTNPLLANRFMTWMTPAGIYDKHFSFPSLDNDCKEQRKRLASSPG